MKEKIYIYIYLKKVWSKTLTHYYDDKPKYNFQKTILNIDITVIKIFQKNSKSPTHKMTTISGT